MKSIRLRDGKERSLQRRHPWVFEGSIARGSADAGETVRVESHAGEFLAWGAYSPSSMFRVRAWSFDETERIDAAFFERRLRRAIALRARLGIASDGQRLVHGEADGLPGLIVDRYGDTLSAQFLSAGAERWRVVIADALLAATGLSRLYERSDAAARTPQRQSRHEVNSIARRQGALAAAPPPLGVRGQRGRRQGRPRQIGRASCRERV